MYAITPVPMNIHVHQNEYLCVPPEIHWYLSSQRAITSLHSMSSLYIFTCIITPLSYINFMKILLLLANNGWRLEKILTFWKPKGNNSYIAQEIMTKLHVHYSIVTYTQNKIHEIWFIAYLNCGYIDPTDSLLTVSDANQPTVDRQSADFVCDFSCFLGSTGGKFF